jgi:hypothetical protein
MKKYFVRVSVDFMDGNKISDTYSIIADNESSAKAEAITMASMYECYGYNADIHIDWIYEK